MITIIVIVSIRKWYNTILIWSDLDNLMHNFHLNDNLYICCFYVDNRFLGG